MTKTFIVPPQFALINYHVHYHLIRSDGQACWQHHLVTTGNIIWSPLVHYHLIRSDGQTGHSWQPNHHVYIINYHLIWSDGQTWQPELVTAGHSLAAGLATFSTNLLLSLSRSSSICPTRSFSSSFFLASASASASRLALKLAGSV